MQQMCSFRGSISFGPTYVKLDLQENNRKRHGDDGHERRATVADCHYFEQRRWRLDFIPAHKRVRFCVQIISGANAPTNLLIRKCPGRRGDFCNFDVGEINSTATLPAG
jgi:hypothetical protein